MTVVGNPENKPTLYRQVAEMTLADIITFNRRRQGGQVDQVAKLTLEDYNSRTRADVSSDDHSGLSKLEQHLCTLFAWVELHGKEITLFQFC